MDPSIRTPHARDFYLHYLNSAEWRKTRNAALQRGGWRCDRCGRKRDLNVHHRSYERLGAEWPDDLEVLCADCHEGEHIEQLERSDSRIYLKIASEAFEYDSFADIGAITERAKQLCADRNIRYRGPEIHRAIGLLTGTRIKRFDPPVRIDGTKPDPGNVTAQQAHEFFCRFPVLCFFKEWPAHQKSPLEQREHEARLREQIMDIKRQLKPERRRPVMERLEAIFAGDM